MVNWDDWEEGPEIALTVWVATRCCRRDSRDCTADSNVQLGTYRK